MSSNRSNHELIANFILDELHKTPGKTLKELHTLLQHNKNIPVVCLQVLGKYLHGLHKQGYVKLTVTRPHRYKLGKTKPPFVSIIPVNKPRHQKLEKPLKVHKPKQRKPKQTVVKRRNSVKIDVYWENKKKDVETRANLILTTIRNNPYKTEKELMNLLQNKEGFRNLQRPATRGYLKTLLKNGYVKQTVIFPRKYTLVNDTPFTYVPVSIYNHRKQG